METTRMTDPKNIIDFVMAGNATFTIESEKTGARYTFKVNAPEDRFGMLFVKLLTGPDNTSDFSYMGMITFSTTSAPVFKLTTASKMDDTSTPVRAFRYMLENLVAGKAPAKMNFYHEGRCGKCGRKLTVPSSVLSGFGPECVKQMTAKYEDDEIPFIPIVFTAEEIARRPLEKILS